MPCYHPIPAYKAANQSKLVFSDTKSTRNKGIDVSHALWIPCGQCVGCRLEKSRQWAMRCVHEAQMHEHNAFITLTYDDKHLPKDGSLHHEHFQLFIKRLRKKLAPAKIRYYMAGEYGERFGRPHYHACIFGFAFPDRKLLRKTSSGSLIYTSKILEDCWSVENRITGEKETIGYSSLGDVTFESAAYIARYLMKKYTGEMNPEDEWIFNKDVYSYCDLETGELVQKKHEYNKMSLKPGIGTNWFKKYRSDVYPHDYVVLRDKKMRPPKFYDLLYKKDNPYEYDEVLYKRDLSAKLNLADNTYERLLVKEQCAQAKVSKLKRTLTKRKSS